MNYMNFYDAISHAFIVIICVFGVLIREEHVHLCVKFIKIKSKHKTLFDL